jgi:drug/metabolite transporter (DMT)-like permease
MAVVFGLAVALSWGGADFLGGFAAKRSPAAAVAATTQATGLVVSSVLVFAFGWDDLSGRDVVLSAGAGIAGVVGVTSLYRGLAIGRMSVVAPVSAVMAAVIPIAWGLARGEEPSTVALVGIALAVIAVAIVAQAPASDDGDHEGRSGIGLAVVAGAGFGVTFICLSSTAEASGLWPVFLSRATAVPILVIALLATGRHLFVARADLPPALVAGVLDMAAHVFLLAAVRRGMTTLVAPVAALYPAGTVLLANVVLREAIGRRRIVGLGTALFALVLIAS